MDPEYFKTLFSHIHWAGMRIFDAADGLDDASYQRDLGLTYKSIQAMLSHALRAELMWMSRLGVPAASESFDQSLPLPLDQLKSTWERQKVATGNYLASVSVTDIDKNIVVNQRDGSSHTYKAWVILTQVYEHTIQHQSEAAEALTMLGRSPGDLDFIAYHWTTM